MCRNIRTLHNFEPPATAEEIQEASLQFVRKLSGASKPSKANERVFNQAVEDIEAVVHRLLDGLVTTAVARDRVAEKEKARLRAAKRFG